MKIQLDELKPYVSLILARIPDAHVEEGVAGAVLNDVKELLQLGTAGRRVLVGMQDPQPVALPVIPPGADSISDPAEAGQMEVGFLHYTEERRPGWYAGSAEAIVDRVNHLVVVCRYNRQFAICLSDPGRRDVILANVGDKDHPGLAALGTIDAGVMNKAFVSDHEARTLWLSGIHTPVKAKPDSKVLSGLDLRDALDPLGDQSYYFTAIRCGSAIAQGKRPMVGVVPRGSRVWTGTTNSWDDFIGTVGRLLQRLEATNTQREIDPLPVLAEWVEDKHDVKGPFDLAFSLPEPLSDEMAIEQELWGEADQWTYKSRFDLLPGECTQDWLTARAILEGRPIGLVKLELEFLALGNVRFRVQTEQDPECPPDEAKLFKNLMETAARRGWFKIWYDSGHVIADGAVFKPRHRDDPFRGFEWIDFGDCDVKKEKPWGYKEEVKYDSIGGGKSLFSWVLKHPADLGLPKDTWLACDDRSMEVADFIGFAVKDTGPVLSLIHVKGAHSDKADRGISVAAYEVVTAQAVKNLRNLDWYNLKEGPEALAKKGMGQIVWHGGDKSQGEEMVAAISAALGGGHHDYSREVWIVQPQLTKWLFNDVKDNEEHVERERFNQLQTLLLAAQASCRSLGAEMHVIGAGPAPEET